MGHRKDILPVKTSFHYRTGGLRREMASSGSAEKMAV